MLWIYSHAWLLRLRNQKYDYDALMDIIQTVDVLIVKSHTRVDRKLLAKAITDFCIGCSSRNRQYRYGLCKSARGLRSRTP